MNLLRMNIAVVVVCILLVGAHYAHADDFGVEGDIEPTTPVEAFYLEATPVPSPTIIPTTYMNSAPVAHAGRDQVVQGGALVVLDGSASKDAEGAIVSYVWKQISGPQVELFSHRTQYPSFSPQNITATYIFQLTVRDKAGASSIDLVTIAVHQRPIVTSAPVAVVSPQITPMPTPIPIVSSSSWLWYALIIIGGGIVIGAVAFVMKFIRNARAFSVVGVVQDAVTHAPIAGAQVQFFDQGTNTFIAEYVTDTEGRFSASPEPSVYVVSVVKPGYAAYAREGVVIPQVVKEPVVLLVDILAISSAI